MEHYSYNITVYKNHAVITVNHVVTQFDFYKSTNEISYYHHP